MPSQQASWGRCEMAVVNGPVPESVCLLALGENEKEVKHMKNS